MKINELPNINEDIIKRNISYDKYNFNSTIFQMKQNSPLTNDMIMNKTSNGFNRSLRGSIDKKNWKDTKLYKGNTLSFFKKSNGNVCGVKKLKKFLMKKIALLENKIMKLLI
jgi:hypothetical protein